MKAFKMLAMATLSLLAVSVTAQTKTDSVKVAGNCGMCKNRIEKAAKAEGVNSSTWNVDTKVLSVTYDADKTTLDQVQERVAAAGHDTEKFKAKDQDYNKLPGCCMYERKEVVDDSHQGSQH